jgi:hypothetical protein
MHVIAASWSTSGSQVVLNLEFNDTPRCGTVRYFIHTRILFGAGVAVEVLPSRVRPRGSISQRAFGTSIAASSAMRNKMRVK